MAASMFTLALADHPSLEDIKPGYAKWGTYRRNRNKIEVKTNIRRPDNSPHPKCGGQVWSVIAVRKASVWHIDPVENVDTICSILLGAYLKGRGELVVGVTTISGAQIKRYKANSKAYSLTTILNSGVPSRRKDKEADKRRAHRRSIDFTAEMLKRKTS